MKNARFILLFAVCFAFVATYMNRSTISIALVSICKQHKVNQTEQLATDLTVKNETINNLRANRPYYYQIDDFYGPISFGNLETYKNGNETQEEEDDDPPICEHTNQGFIMSASFWSSLLLQIPFGILINKFGGFTIMFVCMFLTGLFSAILPLFVYLNIWWVVFLRFLIGATAAATSPAGFHLIDVWLLKKDKTIASAFNSASQTFGVVVTLGMAGIIAEAFGWQGIFFFTAIAAIVSGVVVLVLVRDDPSAVKWLPTEELKMIQQENKDKQRKQDPNSAKKSHSTPWFGLLTNKAFLSLLFFRFTSSWVNMVYANELSFFLDQVAKMSITKNGLMGSATQVTRIVATLSSGYLSEYVIRSGWMSRVVTRKFFSIILGFGQATCLCIIPYITHWQGFLIFMLLFSTFISGFSSASTLPMHYELSSRHAVSLFTISNTFTNLTGVLVPVWVGFLLDLMVDSEPMVAWSYVFFSSAAMLIFTNILFLIFANAEDQDEKLESRSFTDVINFITCKKKTRFDLRNENDEKIISGSFVTRV